MLLFMTAGAVISQRTSSGRGSLFDTMMFVSPFGWLFCFGWIGLNCESYWWHGTRLPAAGTYYSIPFLRPCLLPAAFMGLYKLCKTIHPYACRRFNTCPHFVIGRSPWQAAAGRQTGHAQR